MALEQLTLDTRQNKVEVAISLLQAWEPPEGFYFADSGGACSSATKDILNKAGVKYDGHYCESPIDPPQIRSFLREHHPDTQWDNHAKNFWKTVNEKGLPMRKSRWCCEIIKEAGGKDRIVVVGNRRAEGGTRKHQCNIQVGEGRARGKTFIRPIIDFDDYDLWQYIRENNVPYCSLYDEGFKRLGCVLCPFSRDIEREMQYFPKITNLWLLACNRLVKAEKERGYLGKRGKPLKYQFKTGQEKFDWWIARK